MKNTDIVQALEKQVEALKIATIKVKSQTANRILESVNMLVTMHHKKYISKKGRGE